MKFDKIFAFLSKYQKTFLVIISILLLPAAALFLLTYFLNIPITDFAPCLSDALYYQKLIEAMVHFGEPLGYWGYNGQHAQIGHWGTWSFVNFYPYALFGRLFGWCLYSMVVCNAVLITISLLIFYVLTKTSAGKMLTIAFFMSFFGFFANYCFTGMIESLQYALMIIMAGFFIRYSRQQEKQNYVIDIIFVFFILCCSMARITYTIFLPFAVYLIFTHKKCSGRQMWYRRGGGSILAAVSILWICVPLKFMSLYCSPYFQRFNFENRIKAFFAPHGTREFTEGLTRLLTGCLPKNITNCAYFFAQLLLFFVLVVLFLLLIYTLTKRLILRKSGEEEKKKYLNRDILTAAFLNIIFWGNICGQFIFYRYDMRLLLVVCVFFVPFLVSKIKFVSPVFITLAVISFLLLPKYAFFPIQKVPAEKDLQETQKLFKSLEITEKNPPWDNTFCIDMSLVNDRTLFFSLPVGSGIQLINNRRFLPVQAKYVIIYQKFKNKYNNIKDNIVAENSKYIIFKNKTHSDK